ncbi:unnamed protein product [Ixodes pacificus]
MRRADSGTTEAAWHQVHTLMCNVTFLYIFNHAADSPFGR